jgi:carbon-monoxide dehydrogenase medium subunit
LLPYLYIPSSVHEVQRHHLRLERYEIPTSVGEALALLAHHRERARVVAGGTDLLLELARGVRSGVDTLIDVTRIPELSRIDLDGDTVRLGGAVSHAQVVCSDLLVERALPLAQACLEVGSPQLRNRATIAGNLVTASPANDTIPPLRALGAHLTLASNRGTRYLPLDAFHTGVRGTALQPDELITAITFPAMRPAQRGVFVKLGLRRAQAISVVNLAAVVEFDGETVTSARLMMGSVAPTIVAAERAQIFLRGRSLTAETITEAARLAAGAITPIDDLRATARYRRTQVEVTVERALTVLAEGGERLRWPDRPVTLQGSDRPETQQATTVNGRPVDAPAPPSMLLLDWLRDIAGPTLGVTLTGTKEGCAEGECGACTVFLDGRAVLSCLVPAPAAAGAPITTVEGLGQDGRLHPLQEAMIVEGAVQCGYCIPGFVMAGAKLLEEHPHPTDEEIRIGLSGNLCRCTGYYPIMAAVRKASRR